MNRTTTGMTTLMGLFLRSTPTFLPLPSVVHFLSCLGGTLVTPLEEGDEAINNVMTELCSDDSLQAHIEKMTEIRDAVFPKIERNIDVAQQKQKQQYLTRTGGLKFTFNNGDTVLRRNMLQKTSKGHKMEDQWIGPYTVEGLDLVKGTCQLRAKDRRLLQRKINLKDLKLYREQSTSQTPSNDALLQESSAQQHPTLPQDSISAVPKNNQSGGSSVWQPTQSTQLSGAAVQQPAPTPTTSQPDGPATHRTAQSTSQPRGAGVQQPVRITTKVSPVGGPLKDQPHQRVSQEEQGCDNLPQCQQQVSPVDQSLKDQVHQRVSREEQGCNNLSEYQVQVSLVDQPLNDQFH